jgi:hypothetical protein
LKIANCDAAIATVFNCNFGNRPLISICNFHFAIFNFQSPTSALCPLLFAALAVSFARQLKTFPWSEP